MYMRGITTYLGYVHVQTSHHFNEHYKRTVITRPYFSRENKRVNNSYVATTSRKKKESFESTLVTNALLKEVIQRKVVLTTWYIYWRCSLGFYVRDGGASTQRHDTGFFSKVCTLKMLPWCRSIQRHGKTALHVVIRVQVWHPETRSRRRSIEDEVEEEEGAVRRENTIIVGGSHCPKHAHALTIGTFLVSFTILRKRKPRIAHV